jgi:hypothetical protein
LHGFKQREQLFDRNRQFGVAECIEKIDQHGVSASETGMARRGDKAAVAGELPMVTQNGPFRAHLGNSGPAKRANS